MAKYKAYPDYKDSGVEWLGDIPTHWICTQIKYGYNITLGKMLQKNKLSSKDELKPYLKAQNIQPTGIDLSVVDNMWFSPDEKGKLLLKNNDVLISEGGDVGRTALWQGQLGECYIQNAINRARAIKGNSPFFLNYWMLYLKSSDFINTLCNKATIAHYTAEKVETSPLLLPDSDEQLRISLFLDHETAKIDNLIESQQQLIELLKEKRQAVISHAVTKGLNPDVPMKDSGVEWLGQVPEHWRVSRIKNYAKIESGHTPSRTKPEYWVSCNIPWVSLNDSKQLKEVDYIEDTFYKISELGMANSSAHLLPARAVVFTRDASIGLSAITTKSMAVSQHLIAWVCDEKFIIPEFLLLVFYAMENEFERYTFGATIKTIGMDNVRGLKSTFPPIEEQRNLIDWAFNKMEKIKSSINRVEDMLSLLQERRTALISAAVTGKIDVRDWVAPDTQDLEEPQEATA